jgi:hypothetical protein
MRSRSASFSGRSGRIYPIRLFPFKPLFDADVRLLGDLHDRNIQRSLPNTKATDHGSSYRPLRRMSSAGHTAEGVWTFPIRGPKWPK